MIRFLVSVLFFVVISVDLHASADAYEDKMTGLKTTLLEYSKGSCRRSARGALVAIDNIRADRDLQLVAERFTALIEAFNQFTPEDLDRASTNIPDSEAIVFAMIAMQYAELVGDPLFRDKDTLNDAWENVIGTDFFKSCYTDGSLVETHVFYAHKSIRKRGADILTLGAGKPIVSPEDGKVMELHHVNQLSFGPVILLSSQHSDLHSLLHVSTGQRSEIDRHWFNRCKREARALMAKLLFEIASPNTKSYVSRASIDSKSKTIRGLFPLDDMSGDTSSSQPSSQDSAMSYDLAGSADENRPPIFGKRKASESEFEYPAPKRQK